MKTTIKYFLLFAFLLLFGACQKEKLLTSAECKSYQISSTVLQKEYTIHVLYPFGFDKKKSYNTLFLLDANDYFKEMVKVINDNYSSEYILIGIDYNRFNERPIDFTYPANSQLEGSGQAHMYIQFLNEELLPFVSKDLQINSHHKTIMGHSLTGYFNTYLLLQQEQTNPFDHIIAASPSLWWEDFYILELLKQYNQNQGELTSTFYITMGDLEGVLMNTHFNTFVQELESYKYAVNSWGHKIYPNISHRNSPILSFQDGLSFIF